MPLIDSPASTDPRAADLRRMKLVALGCLLASLAGLAVSLVMGAQGPWAWLKAFCEAAAKWAKEEEQHGLALGRWAELADPDFKLDDGFARFTAMYRIPVDATESVRGSRAAELCARCVVETGTSSLYSALRDAADEPVLKAICKNIALDEFKHYRLFYVHMERMMAAA